MVSISDLTVNLEVGVEFDMPDLRRPTFWEWLTRKKVVPFTSRWKVESVVTSPGCSHAKRMPYEPEFSVGDESDMQSSCIVCGRVLRDAPNCYGDLADVRDI